MVQFGEGMLVIMMDDDMQGDDGIGFPKDYSALLLLCPICWWQLP